MRQMLEPIEGPVVPHRSPTPGSRYAEGLLVAFLGSGASAARVRVEDTPYEIGALYELCRRAARKKDFARRVTVSKNDGRLILARTKGD